MDRKLNLYAKLIVKQGINLEKGEMLAIAADVVCADLAEAVAEEAYKQGARKVVMFWTNSNIGKLGFQYQTKEELSNVPQWVVASREYLLDEKAAYLSILSERPDHLKDVDPEKIKCSTIAMNKAIHKFRESTGSNRTRWCLAAYPNIEWAEKVFPNLKGQAALDKLWEYMHKTLRLDTPDVVKAWKTHSENLQKRSKILNDAKIKTLHFKNKLGTDFTVGLPKEYHFTGAVEKSAAGREFTANLPTEEVFASPDCRIANGRLVASLPLVRRGAIIRDFYLDFKDGRVVDFGAKEGYETLKGIIETDEGSHYLGEVALVGYNSPIQNLNALFYNTLFDENASCHFAVGRGFSACIHNGNSYSKEQLKEMGINDSLEHVDFMVGTKDLSIVATTMDGKEMVIFKDGDWVF